MGKDFMSLFRRERKRLLWLVGITFAVILALQCFELPYGSLQPSVFSSDKLPASDSSADPPSVSEMSVLNQQNSTVEHLHPIETVNKTKISEEKDTISGTGYMSEQGTVSNKSLGFDESDGSSAVLSENSDNNSIGVNLTREVNITSGSDHKLETSDANFHSPSHAIPPTYLTPPITTPPVLSNDSEEIDFTEGEREKPSQDDVDAVSKNSSITSVHKETKDSHLPVPEVTSISEMNTLLLQNRASYRSMVNE